MYSYLLHLYPYLSQLSEESLLYTFFYQYQSSECGNGFGCFRRPENCTGEDCEYLITYRAAENMSNYVDISMTTKWQWIGLGHNMVPLMVNNTTFKSHPKNLVLKNWRRNQYFINNLINLFRGGSRAAATSKMELFVIIVNGFKPSWMLQQPQIRLCFCYWMESYGKHLFPEAATGDVPRSSHRRCSVKKKLRIL